MADPNPHQLMICPYNMAHQVEQYRMHIHLQKCRKQYQNQCKTTCPFDSTHTVHEMELDYHISVCPKRIMLDSQIYVVDDEHAPIANVETPQVDLLPSEENWDDDNMTSYKPDFSKKAVPMIVKAKGMTPAERRQARMEGRLAYQAASRSQNEQN